MRRLVALIGIFVFAVGVTFAEEYVLISLGGKAKMVVTVDKKAGITATCFYLDKEMTTLGPIGMETTDGKDLGSSPKVRSVHRRIVDEMITPAVAQKRKQIPDRFAEMEILFRPMRISLSQRMFPCLPIASDHTSICLFLRSVRIPFLPLRSWLTGRMGSAY
ncbi:MAG: hypothetical protein WC865_10605 [Bacteroidales bacterium]